MARDKRRFTFINRLLAPPPTPVVPVAILEQESPDTTERVHRFFDSGPPQTTLGIIGGLVGTFLDGRYYALLGLYLVYGMLRSKSLRGLSMGVQLWMCTAVGIFACGGFFWIGLQINNAKPHVYTPSEYLAAAKSGTPLPITQQITQYYPQIITNTRVIEPPPVPLHTHIIFVEPTLVKNPVYPDVPMVSVGYTNRGNAVVLHSSIRMVLSYADVDDRCGEASLKDFRNKIAYGLEGPMLGVNDSRSKVVVPDNTPLVGRPSILRLVAGVKWEDDSGQYETTTHQFLNPIENRWNSCPANNGEREIDPKHK